MHFKHPLKFAEIWFWHIIWSILVNILWAIEKDMNSTVVGYSVLQMSTKSSFLIM